MAKDFQTIVNDTRWWNYSIRGVSPANEPVVNPIFLHSIPYSPSPGFPCQPILLPNSPPVRAVPGP